MAQTDWAMFHTRASRDMLLLPPTHVSSPFAGRYQGCLRHDEITWERLRFTALAKLKKGCQATREAAKPQERLQVAWHPGCKEALFKETKEIPGRSIL